MNLLNSLYLHPKNDKVTNILNFISNSLKSFSNLFLKNKYDYLLVLGDRYELIAPCVSSFFNKIKIIHINGGDITLGSLDNEIRNFQGAQISLQQLLAHAT